MSQPPSVPEPPRTAVVTGAGGAIGRAVARRLGEDGFRVACVDARREAARATADQINGARAFGCDVRSEEQVTRLRDDVTKQLGATWLLVNVAGVFFTHKITELSVQDWDLLIDVNLKGTFLTCRAFLPAMTAAASGCIINVASTAGVRGGRTRAAYCASKGGVVLLTRSLALDHGPEGVRINCLCPGLIDTPMAEWLKQDPAAVAEWERGIPAQSIGTVGDVAAAASFLASAGAGYLHGSVMMVDGGVTA